MHKIIALWSHPRSMSTAMERAMRERGDLDCAHEPFMYDYYVNRLGRPFPHFDVQEGHPTTYDAIRDMLLNRARARPVFFKDMSYYVMPHILEDTAFLDRLTNCFLIRNPVASILSYHKLDPEFSLTEVGLESQWLHYQGLVARGETPVVIEADSVRQDTRAALGAMWERIGLPHSERAFAWQDEVPQDWQQVQGWHGTASQSSGIRPLTQEELDEQARKFAEAARATPRLQEALDHHLPFYEKLKALAI